MVVESFRPGRLEAWGLGYDALSEDNPSLVLTRVSGFGGKVRLTKATHQTGTDRLAEVARQYDSVAEELAQPETSTDPACRIGSTR